MECRTLGHHIATNARRYAYFFCTAQIASKLRSKKAGFLTKVRGRSNLSY
jgi:hypothetical protein